MRRFLLFSLLIVSFLICSCVDKPEINADTVEEVVLCNYFKGKECVIPAETSYVNLFSIEGKSPFTEGEVEVKFSCIDESKPSL